MIKYIQSMPVISLKCPYGYGISDKIRLWGLFRVLGRPFECLGQIS
jgi:hypothetical protein